MDPQWDDSLPIYRQLRDRIVAMILEEALREGDPLPSVRSVAAEFRLNPLQCLRPISDSSTRSWSRNAAALACSSAAGRARRFMTDERQRFLSEVWPKVYATMQRLGPLAERAVGKAAPLRQATVAFDFRTNQ